METGIIGNNIKKLRDEQDITQKMLADALGISYQAVSKWENGVTSPDISVLPEIAGYFGVSIDELFKHNLEAYRNKAGRLVALYESDTGNDDAYHKAEAEFCRLFTEQAEDADDMAGYAYLHDLRARYHNKLAEESYLKSMENNGKSDSYYKTQRQYILFLSRLGRNDESIERYSGITAGSNANDYSSLVCAYMCAGQYEKALETAEKGLMVAPENPILLTFAGDICSKLGKFGQAVKYWDRAFERDPEMIDTRYSLYRYLKSTSRLSEAAEVLEQIIQWNDERGYNIENKPLKKELRRING